jgi:hypothetical protein
MMEKVQKPSILMIKEEVSGETEIKGKLTLEEILDWMEL